MVTSCYHNHNECSSTIIKFEVSGYPSSGTRWPIYSGNTLRAAYQNRTCSGPQLGLFAVIYHSEMPGLPPRLSMCCSVNHPYKVIVGRVYTCSMCI